MGMAETEMRAMSLNQPAVLQVVSALRRYRALCADLSKKRYSDGECDGATLTSFFWEVEAIEDDHSDEGGE